ncbi:MAG: SIR2 family NAD-dependent protein deacylase [Bacteroidota bacterium]|jgi:NAD-dependent deacetylase
MEAYMTNSTKGHIVVFTGAGISAESGIKTFRDSGGLWEEYDIYDVATPEAWRANPDLVTRFYNDRRKQIMGAKPNDGHAALAKLEKEFDVTIITQNIDDLHERAGSSKVLHLHGEIMKSRSTKNNNLVYDIEGWELTADSKCELGSRLRPHIVWFGESVPMMETALEVVRSADCFIIVGTSLEVYPAAGLTTQAPTGCAKYYVDPNAKPISGVHQLEVIPQKAGLALPELADRLIQLGI